MKHLKFFVGAIVGMSIIKIGSHFLDNYRFVIVNVTGDSMNPTLKNGDKIFCNAIRKHTKKKICVGNIVVIKDVAEEPDKLIIKRVSKIKKEKGKTKLYVLGDNLKNSRDSRIFGWVDEEKVIAVCSLLQI